MIEFRCCSGALSRKIIIYFSKIRTIETGRIRKSTPARFFAIFLKAFLIPTTKIRKQHKSFNVHTRKEEENAMTSIQYNQRRQRFRSEVEAIVKRKRKRDGRDIDAYCSAVGDNSHKCYYYFYANSNVVLLATVVAFLLLSEPTSAAAWLSKMQSAPSVTTTTAWNRNRRKPFGSDCRRLSRCSRKREQRLRLYDTPQMPEKPDGKMELRFADDDYSSSSSSDLDTLRRQAEKLRREAESLQSALQESKEAKIQKQINKVDGWIDDLLIEVTLGDGTELLKTVDQVYDVLVKERYSAHHVLKIFERLCDMRAQESRSNCSPLMELLVDATGKIDCLEKEDNPNKRWNHRVERVLRKKLFARDWNIEYVSEDEKFW
jgi:hypothetical protein